MYEDQFIVTMWIAGALALWVLKLKWTNRRLRKQIATLTAPPAEAQAAIPPTLSAPPIAVRDPELDRLRERVAVLERITVEKEHSLAREIDGLRAR